MPCDSYLFMTSSTTGLVTVWLFFFLTFHKMWNYRVCINTLLLTSTGSTHTNTQTLKSAFKLSPEHKQAARRVRLTLSNWPTQLKGGSAVYLHTAQRLRGQMLSCTCTYGPATHYEGGTDTRHAWRPKTHMLMHKHTTKSLTNSSSSKYIFSSFIIQPY